MFEQYLKRGSNDRTIKYEKGFQYIYIYQYEYIGFNSKIRKVKGINQCNKIYMLNAKRCFTVRA